MAKNSYDIRKKKKKNKRFLFFRKKNYEVKSILKAQA